MHTRQTLQVKKTLEQFSQEAKRDQDAFDLVDQVFADKPDLVKVTRMNGNSYIWYADPETNQKIVIRLANKDVNGHVLGAGTYGRAKYGVDRNGKLYAIKIQHNYVTQYSVLNVNNLSVHTQIGILNGSVHMVPPNTFIVINNMIYFQAGRNQPPTLVPRPDWNAQLENNYDALKDFILEQQSNQWLHTKDIKPITREFIRLLLASNIDLVNNPVNQSMSPVEETQIAYDVRLAHGEKTRRETSTFLLEIEHVEDKDLEYGTLYLHRTADGHIGYKMLDVNGNIIRRATSIPYPRYKYKPSFMKLKTDIMSFARAEGDIPSKHDTTPVALTGDKQYQVLQLGESNLYDALSQHIDLEEKISITRRLLWECSKLHTGKLSRSHQSYIHCDIKPQNVLLNSKQKNVRLIDYGLAVSADTTATLIGSPCYAPMIDGTDPQDPHADNFDHDYAARVAGLQTGFDVFMLKRIIHMPTHIDMGNQRCIFSNDEWNALPQALKQNIASMDNDVASTDRAVNIIRTRHETALDLAIRFIAMEAVDLSKPIQEKRMEYEINRLMLTSNSMSTARQEIVCECAELLDLIQVHDPAQTQVSAAECSPPATPTSRSSTNSPHSTTTDESIVSYENLGKQDLKQRLAEMKNDADDNELKDDLTLSP